jgi:hypothetical protein
MNMLVVVQAPGMGVKNRDGSGTALKLGVVLGKRFDGFPATASHQRIERTLMMPVTVNVFVASRLNQ